MKRAFFILIFVISELSYSQVEYKLEGFVLSEPFNKPISNGQVTIKTQTNDFLGKTEIDETGYYSITFILTELEETPGSTELTESFFLTNNYPNPYNPSTTIFAGISFDGNYTIGAYTVLGERIFQRDFLLQKGMNKFKISGLGAAGIKLITIYNPKGNSRSIKMMQLDGSSLNPQIDLLGNEQYGGNQIKKSAIEDSIKVIFESFNHFSDSVIVAVIPYMILDRSLMQIPFTKTATINGHITNSQTNENVIGANIAAVDPSNNSRLFTTTTNINGRFTENYDYNLWADDGDTIINPEIAQITIDKLYHEKIIVDLTTKESMVLDTSINKTGKNYSFYIYPYDVNGKQIDSITICLAANGNQTFLFNKISWTGEIYVHFTDYSENPDKTAKLSHLNSNYLQWIIGRTPNQPLDSYNIYQTTRPDTSSPLTMPTLNLTEMEETTTDMYLIPSKVPNPQQPGQYITMDGDTVQYMMRRDGPGNTKFMKSEASDTTDCVILTWNRTTGNPVDPTKIQNTQNQYQKVLDAYTLNNGTQLLNHKLYTIDSFEDPRWQAIVNRGFDNTARTWYENTTIPGNSVSYGQPPGRIKESYSSYSEYATTPTIFSELFEQITGNRDPPGIGTGTTGYVWNPTTQNMTDFGKILLRMRSLLDRGTPY